MKAWQVNEYCDPSGMTFAEVPVPEPAKGQILIRNYAVGVNFFESWKPWETGSLISR